MAAIRQDGVAMAIAARSIALASVHSNGCMLLAKDRLAAAFAGAGPSAQTARPGG
jgi:hypothetical protein